jgi:hypothetical protein
MAIFNRLTKKEIYEEFQYEGWFYLCPIYSTDPDKGVPCLQEKNWVPEWWLDLNTWGAQTYNMVGSFFNPEYEGEDFVLRLSPLEKE